MSSVYALEIMFEPSQYDNIINELYNLDITTFQEGQTSVNDSGDAVLENTDSMITCYFENSKDADGLKANLNKVFDNSLNFNLIAHEDNYQDKWKEYANPVEISDNILIQPSWKVDPEIKKTITINLDPGYAFGSGSHDTTILCARAIEEICKVKVPGSLLDVGCGSGILAIIASKLGIREIDGIDIDPIAIESSYDNAAKNNCTGIKFDTTPLNRVDKKYDIIVANILSSTLYELFEDIKRVSKEKSIVILSGILNEEIKEFLDKTKIQNESITKTNTWCCIKFTVV